MNMLLAIGFSALLPFLGACTSTKSYKITIERPNKDDQVAKQIDQARTLYDMGEIEASIAHLSILVDKGAYTASHDEAYELLISWLLAATRKDEAKRYASYFLMHHRDSPSANRIVEIFRDHDDHLIKDGMAKEEGDPDLKPHDDEEENKKLESEQEENEHHFLRLEPRDTTSLGILLPLSGPFAGFGKKALMAMSIALHTSLVPGEQKISLYESDGLKVLVADTSGDPTIARTMVDTLAHKHRVALLIGEITPDASITVAQRCQLLGIPLLTLSRHPLARDMGAYVFGFNLSEAQETRALVAHALNTGHRRFGVLYPRHNSGINRAKIFYDEVIAQGGEISALEAYDAHETTFSDPINKLVGLYYSEARAEYAHCEQNKELILKEKGLKNCKEALNPVVDFDALFIPEFNKLAFIAPALVQADILISNNEAAIRSFSRATKIINSPVVQLLGTNAWHDQELLAKLGSKANGAFFIDAVDYEDEALDAFKKALPGQEALSSLEIFAHDAAKLASNLLRHSPKNSIELKNKLAHHKGTVGLLKDLSFNPANELITQTLGFEINDGRSSVITLH